MVKSLPDFWGDVPAWVMFTASAAIALIALEGGFRLGKNGGRLTRKQEALVRTVVGSTVGLLTFTLVFTFWIASSHYHEAREAVLDEAGSIGKAYLRAVLLPEPYRAEIRGLLREYVDVRLSGLKSGDLNQSSQRAEEMRRRIWSLAVDAREKTGDHSFDEFLRRSLSKFIELHTRRVGVQTEFKIPGMVWASLYAIMALTMVSIGCHAGMTNMARTPVILILVLILSALMILIADLDDPRSGALKVNHWSLIELRNSMEGPGD